MSFFSLGSVCGPVLAGTAEPDVSLRVLYQVWDSPMYTLSGAQIISNALRLCGAENIFADVALPAPQVSIELVIARNPEVI